ncbi:MAG: sulfurtransferase, partial [Candidatus Dormibacteraceae bacterium]
AWAGPRETATPPPAAGDFTAGAPDRSRYLDHGEVAGRGPEVILLDARAPERYRGETEPVDPRPGHIPGARSAFWKGSVGADGRLLRAPALRARFASLGVTEGSRVVAYCGSGVNACHDLLALEVAGLGRGRLYAGSWSDWSSRPDAAVATGDEQV